MIPCQYLAGKMIPRDCHVCFHFSRKEQFCQHPNAPKPKKPNAQRTPDSPDPEFDVLLEGIKDLEKRHIEY